MSDIVKNNIAALSQESFVYINMAFVITAKKKFHSFDLTHFDYVTQLRVLSNKLIFSCSKTVLFDLRASATKE